MNRKIMWSILGNRKKEEILNNKKVVKKPLYSTSAKVFRLRCRSGMLTKRTSLKWATKMSEKYQYVVIPSYAYSFYIFYSLCFTFDFFHIIYSSKNLKYPSWNIQCNFSDDISPSDSI